MLSALQIHSFPHLADPLDNIHLHHIDYRNNNLFTQNKNKHILEPKTKGFGIFQNNP